MSKFSIKSVLLGIGIGMIITSIASMIYFAGAYPQNELSEQDIARLAEKYDLLQTAHPAANTGIFINSSAAAENGTSTQNEGK